MTQLEHVKELKSKIYEIANKHNAVKVYIFGSCARGEETPDSDVDFLVEFNSQASLFDQVGLQLDLSDILGCKVDVVSKRGLHPYISNAVLSEAVAL